MKKFLTGIIATIFIGSANAVEIEVAYPYSGLFDVTYQRIMPQFEAAHPDIKVKFRATYENYEDATSTILREATSGNLPSAIPETEVIPVMVISFSPTLVTLP